MEWRILNLHVDEILFWNCWIHQKEWNYQYLLTRSIDYGIWWKMNAGRSNFTKSYQANKMQKYMYFWPVLQQPVHQQEEMLSTKSASKSGMLPWQLIHDEPPLMPPGSHRMLQLPLLLATEILSPKYGKHIKATRLEQNQNLIDVSKSKQ